MLDPRLQHHVLLLLSSAAILGFVIVTPADAGSVKSVEDRMRMLEAQVHDLEAQIHDLDNSPSREDTINQTHPAARRSTSASMFSFPVQDLSELNANNAYMLCPAWWYPMQNCLHVGGGKTASGDNGWDVRLLEQPDEVHRIASRYGTLAGTAWNIAHDVDGEGTLRITSLAKEMKYKPLFWNWWSDEVQVGWGHILPTDGEHNSNDWEFHSVPHAIPAWRLQLGEGEYRLQDQITERSRDNMWLAVTDGGADLFMNVVGVATPWHIFQLPSPSSSPAVLADLQPGRYFRICNQRNCLVSVGCQNVDGWAKPADSEDNRAHPESLWHVYNDWANQFVIESALCPGRLLHVDENAHLTIHPTSPNPGSRWNLKYLGEFTIDGRQLYSIQPSQRHTDKHLGSRSDFGLLLYV